MRKNRHKKNRSVVIDPQSINQLGDNWVRFTFDNNTPFVQRLFFGLVTTPGELAGLNIVLGAVAMGNGNPLVDDEFGAGTPKLIIFGQRSRRSQFVAEEIRIYSANIAQRSTPLNLLARTANAQPCDKRFKITPVWTQANYSAVRPKNGIAMSDWNGFSYDLRPSVLGVTFAMKMKYEGGLQHIKSV